MRINAFELERFFAKYEFSAPYLLGSSDCEAMNIEDLLALEPGSEKGFQKCWLGYTESMGHPLLREEIAHLYSECSADEVLVHSGAEEAIFIFMNVMLQPGDHVVVQSPCYQSLFQIASDLGCQVTRWFPENQPDWHWNLETLKDLIKPNTKAVIINQPHNPTGYLMSREEQAQLIWMLKERDLLLFSDEVYRCLEHDPALRLPAACDLYENAVSLGVMSKTYGLAGLRIGWIATRNKTIFREMATFKDYTSICNSAPSEYLALIGLRNQQQLIDRNLAIVETNLTVLDQFFKEYPDLFEWQAPRAGSIAFPRFLGTAGAEQFCVDLVEKQGVLLIPSVYFHHGDSHFRIGFGRQNLPECVTQLETYVKQHREALLSS
ncbi:aminotransferase class I/II-fold pyridoxal phosphate-dependent enzyme [Anoxynatronum buryatiense]|uniref:Aspartate/methionine/tyrosine aminotransferase n=1 Tax=Anoxynatronum buryatiense TaxID=489973 RepID=A0AA45WWY7_9CLOT|nr:aminotransferase class I/II-fold pyridoxal phosphate-dependent enzyme [Anoxynatronum buryatiense]SMP60244.1 Aspartate/methionine/tyrosine aminotransferase [Anoxynatronum buryatiense]